MILFEANFNNTDNWHHHCLKYTSAGIESIDVGNVFVPGEFDSLAFWHGKPVAHNPANTVGWAQPEGHHESITQFPTRVYTGFAAWMMFGMWHVIDAALMKKLTVPRAGVLRITCYCHAWSSNADIADKSDDIGSVGYDVSTLTAGLTPGQQNISFGVGVGDMPFVLPLMGRHIYNKYAPVVAEFPVQAGDLNVYARGRALWEFKHNNMYFDSFKVELLDQVVGIDPPRTN